MIAPMLCIDQVATRLGINRDGVSKLIQTGELRAVNVNRNKKAKRPTWRIRPEDLDAFEESRLSTGLSPPAAKTRKKRKQAEPRNKWF